ncbi:hypothetical protein [Pectobacterium punjabense]|uniref:hypothetical protein n=1 Tax=Pectobacterium punjabense TaxID=2108399 RepID=UPI00311F6788
MNGINPITIALKNLNSSLVQIQTKVGNLQPSVSSMLSTQPSTKVTLSEDSRYKDLLSQIKLNTVSSANGNNTKSLQELMDLSFGTVGKTDSDLSFLEDKPETNDPARLALAEQAANYIRDKYRQEKNPFEGLSREILSSVAYDRSGAWTAAERLAAEDQMARLDIEYGNEVFFETRGHDGYDTEIINLMTDLKKIDGMSEAEKEEKGITEESIEVMQNKVSEWQGKNKEKLFQYTPPDYKNIMKSDFIELLIAKENGNGVYNWETASSEQVFRNILEKNERVNASSMVYLG